MTGESTTHLTPGGRPCGYGREHGGNCRSPEGLARYKEASKRYHQSERFQEVRERWNNAHPAAMLLAQVNRNARERGK